MTAEFYLVNISFKYHSNKTKKEITDAIKHLATDIEFIQKNKSNNDFYKNKTIYQVELLDGVRLLDALYDVAYKNTLNEDVLQYLRIIIDSAKQTILSTEDIIDFLKDKIQGVDDKIYGLLCLHKIEKVEDIEDCVFVYNKNNWLQFRRHFLGKFSPKSTDDFIEECKNYFPNLFFHERNKQTIKEIYKDCQKTIIHHLSELNDKYNIARVSPYNRKDTIRVFNANCRFDSPASIEGNINKKQDFSFFFLDNINNNTSVYCELHLKPILDDFGAFLQRRIYFHEGFPNIENGKILIGHIGRHL